MLSTSRSGNTTVMVNLAAQPNKVADFPQITWWRCGSSVILTAGALLARILCGLHGNGNHFWAGGEAVITMPWHLPLGHDTVDFCVRERQHSKMGMIEGCLINVILQVCYWQCNNFSCGSLWHIEMNSVTLCGWREVFPRPNKKRKTAKKQTTISAWQTFEIWPQNTVSFIHRKSRGYLWRGVDAI